MASRISASVCADPVATEEEFQALSAELSQREQMAVEAEKAKAVQHERRNHRSGQRLSERRLEMTIRTCASTMRQYRLLTATSGRDTERRRELVAGCQRCADCEEKRNTR